MQTKLKKYISFALLFISIGVMCGGLFLTSCKHADEGDNGITVLNSYGPMPVARGAELRFIGQNLDKVTAISLPGGIEIPASSFGTKTSTLITITVPQDAIEGVVVVESPQGDITTKTPLGFSEPISISSYTPVIIKADSVLTINGDYLNLVKQIIFTDRITVDVAAFISQSRTQIKVKIPAAAQTGKIAVSNGKEDPIIVYSTDVLTVKLPAIASFLPNPVKAGTSLTITGTDLDLVKSIKTMATGGTQTIKSSSFSSQSATQIVFAAPDTTQDDFLSLVPASGVIVKSSAKLIMVVPTVSVTPTTVKNGGEITVTGTNLDLIDKVVFGGAKNGTIKTGGTTTQIIVTVPIDATTEVVKFITKATKEVAGPKITLIDPVISSIVPTIAKAKSNIVINGTDLDLVADVVFFGGLKGTIGSGRTDTQLTVTVPVGAKDGKIKLVTKNGSEIQSTDVMTIPANLPEITSFTEASGARGKMLSINGTNMLLIKQLVFPGNVVATDYGTKSDTKVEVYVPNNTVTGLGKIKLFTYEGEEGLSPQLFFSGTDPIVDNSLVFFNFDGKGSWWGGTGAEENDVALSLDGSKYWRVHGGPYTGWSAFFFRNGKNDFPANTIGTNVSQYVLKFDINVIDPITNSDPDPLIKSALAIRLKGTSGDFFYNWAPWVATGSYQTTGWITITVPISEFKSGSAQITDMSTIDADFGMVYNNGGSKLNLCIDNVRFEKTN